jgi:hypothetical protein
MTYPSLVLPSGSAVGTLGSMFGSGLPGARKSRTGNASCFRRGEVTVLVVFDAKPKISRLPGAAAGKYCLLLDEPRGQLCWLAHNNTFHVIALDGTVRTNLTLLGPGKDAVLQYPHLTLATDGALFAGWTTGMPTGYLYRSVPT